MWYLFEKAFDKMQSLVVLVIKREFNGRGSFISPQLYNKSLKIPHYNII